MASWNASARVRESTGPLGTNLPIDSGVAKPQSSEPGDERRLHLGRSLTLPIIALTTCNGVQGLLHRSRRAGHHPGYVAQACALVSHPPTLLHLVLGQSRWAPNVLPAGPGPFQPQLDPFTGGVHLVGALGQHRLPDQFLYGTTKAQYRGIDTWLELVSTREIDVRSEDIARWKEEVPKGFERDYWRLLTGDA